MSSLVFRDGSAPFRLSFSASLHFSNSLSLSTLKNRRVKTDDGQWTLILLQCKGYDSKNYVGCNQVKSVGFSTDGIVTIPTMRKLNRIWVTLRMHFEIYSGDVVAIETWCQREGRIGTRRDWILLTLYLCVTTSSRKWVMMNQDTRRLHKDSDDVWDFDALIPEEENNRSLKKIPKLEDPAKYLIIGLKLRLADLDMNHMSIMSPILDGFLRLVSSSVDWEYSIGLSEQCC
ncbi:unnamed protein product [Eruca vesicaria subsp. sativa]|uniref:Acyl-[acyl-carrier-protein] hydrolase n=1 Tax=Eruca vesicaria subsp. sativa TaxID=29727 RepID=A0ABC8M3M9_ERUVS|nr:unnamed protein product [Eruca vesicaria subsp. sativa]